MLITSERSIARPLLEQGEASFVDKDRDEDDQVLKHGFHALGVGHGGRGLMVLSTGQGAFKILSVFQASATDQRPCCRMFEQ